MLDRQHPRLRVDDEHDDVGLVDRRLGLPADAGLDLARAVVEAAGVDEGELTSAPFDRRIEAVLGGAGLVLDDGDTVTDQAIEQGGLADVGPSDDGHETTAHTHTLRRRVAATPRKRPLATELSRIVASLDGGRDRAGPPLPRVTAATESVPLLLAAGRPAIAKAGSALSPLSRVLELRNLAETLAHASRAEALTMYRHALETLRAHDLDPRLAPALHNGFAYAAICAGDLDLAETELAAASRDALRLRIPLMHAYALYNRSIVAELRDNIDGASEALVQAREVSESAKLRDLVAWCWIRESWLGLKRKDRAAADRSATSARKLSGSSHAEALATLDAMFTLIDGDHLTAAKLFGELAKQYLARSAVITAVALLPWRSVPYRTANAPKGAKAAARQACALQRRGPVRVSPSWWAREIVEAARVDAGERCADNLLETTVGILDAPREAVEVHGDEVPVARGALPPATLQRQSGARVLRRLFGLLVGAHPRVVSRDVLADELWPESDGDKAVRNLYAATKDLRRVLVSAPGLHLVARGGGPPPPAPRH